MDSKTKKYWENLPLAYKLYDKFFGPPNSHQEWAKGFNIRGEIVKILIDEKEV